MAASIGSFFLLSCAPGSEFAGKVTGRRHPREERGVQVRDDWEDMEGVGVEHLAVSFGSRGVDADSLILDILAGRYKFLMHALLSDDSAQKFPS